MNIQVRHDNHIEGGARLIEYVNQRLTQEFDRQHDRITHFEVHFSDENSAKHGDHEQKCMIEARAGGLKPIAVTCKDDTIEQAFDGAIEKLHHALEHQIARNSGSKHNDLKHQEVELD
jgi:ribosomal subunit interface protein